MPKLDGDPAQAALNIPNMFRYLATTVHRRRVKKTSFSFLAKVWGRVGGTHDSI